MNRPSTTQQTQQPVAVGGYSGMWSRGAFSTCPLDHLNDCFNCAFPGKEQVGIRPPFIVSSVVTGNIIWHFVSRLSVGDVFITLDDAGNLKDANSNTLLHVFDPTKVDSFCALNIFNRVYISPTFKGRAADAEFTYYYDGNVFVKAAGVGPTTAPVLTQPIPGNVDPGIHKLGVCFQYSTGYLSPPSPVGLITSDGVHNIHVASIPLGSTTVVARVLVMTRANEEEYFFIPNGTINDNTTTIFNYNDYDTSLIVSADWTNDVMTEIPSCSCMRFYAGRMLIIGQHEFPDNLLVSQVEQPEDINSVTGVINFPVDYGVNVCSTAAIIRDIVYVMKPYGTYAIQDNGQDPSTWTVTMIDSGIGAYDNGISVFASSSSSQDVLDTALVINKRGLMLFNGAYQGSLTYKIETLWELIDQRFMGYAQIAHDVWNKIVYIAVPLKPPAVPGAKVNSGVSASLYMFLMMDYNEGLDPTNVKWSVWTSNLFPAKRILVENFTLTGYGDPFVIYQLTFCNGTNNLISLAPKIFKLSGVVDTEGKLVTWDSGNTFSYLTSGDIITITSVEYTIASVLDATHLYLVQDAGTQTAAPYTANISQTAPIGDYDPINGIVPINQYVITPVVSFGPGVNVFTSLDLDVIGHGTLNLYLFDKNRTIPAIPLRGFNLDEYGNQDLTRLINFTDEGMQLMLQCGQDLL